MTPRTGIWRQLPLTPSYRNQGDKVRPTEHIASLVSKQEAGLFAKLGDLLHVPGGGAPSFEGDGRRSHSLAQANLLESQHRSATRAAFSLLRWPKQITLVVLLLSASMVFAGSALAATHRGFTGSFGSAGSGAGGLSEPQGVAVSESTGDVFVVDRGNLRVDVFDSSGVFVRAWGWGVGDGVSKELQSCSLVCFSGIAGSGAGQFNSPEAIAVDNSGSVSDPSNGDVYVTDTATKVVDKFGPEGKLLGQILNGSGGAPFTGLQGVAVDGTGGLWVYEGVTESVYSEHSGEVLSYSDAAVNVLGSECKSQAGGNVEPGFAVDAEGDFYVGHRLSRKFAKLKSNCEVDEGREEVSGEGSTAIAVEPVSDDVYANSGPLVGVFTAAGALVEKFDPKHPLSGYPVSPRGLAVSSATGAVYVGDLAGNTVDVFKPGETPEAPVTAAATAVGASGATLHGELNPGGKAGPLEYQFEYSKGASCAGGESTPVAELAEAKKAVVPANVTGLQPSAEYTFCLVALNTFGATLGNELHLTTLPAPPVVESESAPAPRSSEATLKAQVNANNKETSYTFEYSTQATGETLEGTITKLPGASPLAAEFASQEARVETGAVLAPTTVYFYRVVAVNAKSEETKGKVEHFTTGPPEKPEALKPEPVTAATALLKGLLNPKQPGNPGTYEFLYRQSNTECRGEGQKVMPASPASGAQGEPAEAEITGLLPNTSYTFCVNVTDEAGEATLSAPVTFTTLPLKPAIAAETATSLTATGVDLNASISPGGLPTSYRFEYGTTTSYGATAPKPDGAIPTGTSPVPVTGHVTGLKRNMTYHWRVVATNEAGTTTGVDHVFVYSTGGSGLPDNRAYEMVTPPVKNAALIGDVFFGIGPEFAADGSRLILSTTQCFGDAGSCNANYNATEGTVYEFTRGSRGWVASELAPPVAVSEVSTARLVNADAGSALFSMPAPPYGQDDFYARHTDGLLTDIGPLTPPELGHTTGDGIVESAIFSTADFSHVVFHIPTPWPLDESAGHTVLEYVGSGNSRPVVVGVRGGAGSTELISVCNTELGAGAGSTASYEALSGDGRTAFFTAFRCAAAGHVVVPANELYARIDQSETVRLSGSECGPGGLAEEVACRAAKPANAEFQGASVDGSKAFFTSIQQLTDNASEDSNETDNAANRNDGCSGTVGVNGCNLYEYDFAEPVGKRLTAVSAGDTSGGGPRVQGVVAISNDGSHVYFVARSVLSGVANGEGATARGGGENLYVFERDAAHPGGVVKFIATLSEYVTPGSIWADLNLWKEGAGQANVSSDGRFLVFGSDAGLTRDTIGDVGRAQVFRYDALTGELVRVSIGEQGFNDNGNAGVGDARTVWGSLLSGFAAGGADRRDPTMSDDGRRVFFYSPIGLTPGALNDVLLSVPALANETTYAENVYEWEQAGVGSCPAGRSEGCVFLISDGRDVSAERSVPCTATSSSVCLLGTDLTGSNVFFKTADQLVPGDTDTQVDYYDARICSSGDPCVSAAPQPLAPCLGESCHGIPAGQPGAPTGGSATLNGVGNLLPGTASVKHRSLTAAQRLSKALEACRRNHPRSKRLRVACERQAHKQFRAKRGRAARGRGVSGSLSGRGK